MLITRPRLSGPMRLGVVMCWVGVAFLGDGDPGEFQDARLGPPGVIELVIAAAVGAIALVLTAGVIVLPRHLIRMGAGRIR